MKQCSKCKEFKEISKFHKDKTKGDGLRTTCKVCKAESDRNYYIENKNSIAEYQQKYYIDNQEKIKEKTKEWKKNPENKKRRNEKYREKYMLDSKFRIKEKLIRKVQKAVKNLIKKDVVYNAEIEKILGCKAKDYKWYLESLFTPEMNWNNYGTYWNVDHIKPVSSFNLMNSFEVLQCFYFFNTRPMRAIENFSKGNKF